MKAYYLFLCCLMVALAGCSVETPDGLREFGIFKMTIVQPANHTLIVSVTINGNERILAGYNATNSEIVRDIKLPPIGDVILVEIAPQAP